MLLRIGGDIEFECDDCGEALETETDLFQEAVDCLKDNEWRFEKFDDVWCHYCPACAEALR